MSAEVEPSVSPAAYVRTLVLAAALGVPVAFAAVLFETAVHDLTQLVWEEIPDGLGWDAPASWYVVLVPAAAGLLVAAATRLPGGGGHAPLEGLGVGMVRPLELVSILPAGLATLSFGLVLGPEAPLIALGLALGALAVRVLHEGRASGELLALAGAFAAISTLFGGPLPAALLLFEALAASGKIPAQALGRALLPGFVAAGTGTLVFTGVEDWPGLEQTSLTLPSLPAYAAVRLEDIAWSAVVAVAAAGVVVVTLRGARELAARASARPATALVGAGLLVGALAVAYRAAVDRPVDYVLFSGQGSLAEVIGEGSASVLVLLVVAKGLAYALSLAAAFRGGNVFPALILGVALGALFANVLPGYELTPAITAGIAASAAAVLRMPFFAVLIAALLVGAAGAETVVIAILAAALGWIVALADARR
ncbi:MAG TPA: chloride channel protein [Gaiellaceae bacterium]|nr:chloride channel protein [Gaiellaceae bacterium]